MLVSLLSGNAGAQPLFKISPTSVMLDENGGSFPILLKSNYAWVSEIRFLGETPWFILDVDSGSGDEVITVSYDILVVGNPLESTGRVAQIDFTNDLGFLIIFTVSQFYTPS